MDLNKELSELKKKVTPLATAKFLVGTVISFGAMEAIVRTLNLPVQSSKGITKIMMKLGIFMLGCKAGDIAEEYFNDKFDQLIEIFNEAKEEEANESDPE